MENNEEEIANDFRYKNGSPDVEISSKTNKCFYSFDEVNRLLVLFASQQKPEIATEISRFELNGLVVKYLRYKKIGEQKKFDGLYSDIKELILDFAFDELKTRIQPSDLQKEVERLRSEIELLKNQLAQKSKF